MHGFKQNLEIGEGWMEEEDTEVHRGRHLDESFETLENRQEEKG